MGSQRQQRVAKQIQQSISTIVEVELSDPRLQLVTFTEVRITPDLRSALVFYSWLGPQAERAQVGEGLERAKGLIRRELGRRLSLRFVPELRFEYDDSAERAERIQRLLASRPDRGGGDE